MITTLPYSTARIISEQAARKVAGPGIVEKKIDDGVYVISCMAGKMTVKVSSGTLSEGDAVNVTQRGNELVIQKTAPEEPGSAPVSKDDVDVQEGADPANLKLVVDAVVGQLKQRIVDKPTLDQLQRILAAVSKTPESFDEDTRKAVSQLKSMVSSMASRGPDISQAASQIADRIIELAENLGQKLKNSGGAIDVVLKPGTNAQEGYYKFDTVKSAVSWLVENKEVNADIPWQKLSATFKDGPVVLKVYESAIGDLRASLVSPDKVNADIEHFAQSNLKAEIWKNVSGSVLVNLLSDRKEIPVDRLLQADKLLSANERSQPVAPAQASREETTSENAVPSAAASKGLETAFGQWLAIALDKDSPLESLALVAPAPAPTPLIDLLRQIDASRQNAGVAPATALEDENIALDRATVVDARRPETVIPDQFRRLGLDLESALSKGRDTNAEDLKEKLLSLQNAIDSAASKAPPPAPSNKPIDAKAALNDITEKLNALALNVQQTEAAKDFSAQMQSVSKEAVSYLDNAEKVIIRLLFGEQAPQTVSKAPAVIAPAPLTDETPLPQENDIQAPSAKETFARSAAAVIEQAVGAGPAQIANASKEIPVALANFQKDLAAALQKLFPQNPVGRDEARRILDLMKPLAETATLLKVTARTQANALPAAAQKLSEGMLQFAVSAAKQYSAGEALAASIPAGPSVSPGEAAYVVQSRMTKTSDQLEKMISDLSASLAKLPDSVAANAARTLNSDTQDNLANFAKDGAAQVLGLLKGLAEQVQAFKTGVLAQAQPMQRQLEQLATTFAASGQSDAAGPDETVAAASQLSSAPFYFTSVLSQNQVSEAKNILDALVRDIGRQMQEFQNKIPSPSQNPSQNSGPFSIPQRRFDGLRADAQTSLAQIARQCSDGLKEQIENATSRLSQLQSGQPVQKNDVEKLAQEFSDASSVIVSRARQQIQDLIEQLSRESGQSEDAAPTAKDLVRQIHDLGTGATQQIAEKVKDLADRMRNIARQITAQEDGVPREIGERATGRTGRQDDLGTLTKDILKQLDELAKSAGQQARDISRQLADLTAQAKELTEKIQQDPGSKAVQGPLDTLKQQVEQVLTRVESMQVLARQVSFDDGQQQVISLPMKIEGRWTDVVVKFLKRKGHSEKGPSKKSVSVVIHVTPTLLGEITVFMDYSGKKDFSMRMEFEKTSSRQWFESNRVEFLKAMGKFGFSSFKIDMNPARRKEFVDPVSQAAPPVTGTIDIRA